MLRSIVVAAIITGAASMAQAQTAPSGCLAPVPISTAALPSDISASTGQTVKTAAVAKAVIEARGYRAVKNLKEDAVGNWAGDAVRDGMEVAVVLQINGEIAEE